jgi:hypothetical protein
LKIIWWDILVGILLFGCGVTPVVDALGAPGLIIVVVLLEIVYIARWQWFYSVYCKNHTNFWIEYPDGWGWNELLEKIWDALGYERETVKFGILAKVKKLLMEGEDSGEGEEEGNDEFYVGINRLLVENQLTEDEFLARMEELMVSSARDMQSNV